VDKIIKPFYNLQYFGSGLLLEQLNASDISPNITEIASKEIAGVAFPLNSTGSSNTPPNNSKF
jgi:hypothetical protein